MFVTFNIDNNNNNNKKAAYQNCDWDRVDLYISLDKD